MIRSGINRRWKIEPYWRVRSLEKWLDSGKGPDNSLLIPLHVWHSCSRCCRNLYECGFRSFLVYLLQFNQFMCGRNYSRSFEAIFESKSTTRGFELEKFNYHSDKILGYSLAVKGNHAYYWSSNNWFCLSGKEFWRNPWSLSVNQRMCKRPHPRSLHFRNILSICIRATRNYWSYMWTSNIDLGLCWIKCFPTRTKLDEAAITEYKFMYRFNCWQYNEGRRSDIFTFE